MVPHGTVEQKIIEAFGLDQDAGQPVAVVGIPDAAKGEALVLLTTMAIAAEEVRAKLLGAGLSNLWVPKLVWRVEQIPVLGTGKTDHKACRQLATELAKQAAGG